MAMYAYPMYEMARMRSAAGKRNLSFAQRRWMRGAQYYGTARAAPEVTKNIAAAFTKGVTSSTFRFFS